MSELSERDLLRAAEAVADGTPVDWDRYAGAGPASQDKIRRLRIVEKIRDVHNSFHDRTQPEDDPLLASDLPRRWGLLEILERLGGGGYGDVYRARDPALQRDVALKLLHESPAAGGGEPDTFLTEARRLARVRHPNVLVVHGAARHDGRTGLWTDLLEGETLETLLRERGPFGAEEAALIGIDVCRALAAVHAAGLVHRDVKTNNIMREAGGRIVLLDFSTVTHRSDVDRGTARGTPLYMAPELFLGQDSGRSADIYSLGVVLYRLVTASYPVNAEGLSDLAEKLGRGESTPLRDVRPDLPTSFVRVVERALEESPVRRYATVGEMERDLMTALGATRPEPQLRPHGTPRIWVGGALAALVVIAVAVGAPWSRWLGTFDIEASLFRKGDGVEERLLPGARIVAGDDLFLEISATEPIYLYVLDEDSRGNRYVLFPLETLDLRNPLPPGVRHRLPGPIGGVTNYWEVTSAGGEEVVLVIASREPLSALELELEGLAPAGSAPAAHIEGDGVFRTLRGIGGLSPAVADSESSLSGISRRLAEEASGTSGLWVMVMRLTSMEKAD